MQQNNINKHRFGSSNKHTEATLSTAFMKLAAVEPRLFALAKHIDRVMRGRKFSFEADSTLWHVGYPDSFKMLMCKLVGWGAKEEALRSMEAYDITYDFLYYYLIEERKFRKLSLDEIADASPEWKASEKALMDFRFISFADQPAPESAQ